MNMGNIYFIKEDFEQSLIHYNQAKKESPENEKAILGIARTYHELQNYGLAETYYNDLKSLNYKMAERFSYLAFKNAAAVRGSDADSTRKQVVWEEEDDDE